ncbi:MULTISPECIES: leucine-rich repeat domain-containing protein [Nocardiopsidaceae]|uniref:Uncharacterized protein n=1 Tax=Streptomonospora nanhaiensis TaxID=1323731 RepID=A0ABY6YH95_9ACTN|nr:hypothetical protein [Streptomonospora nanhaiensis]WAE71574.1 hypothetical protein OUQ99_20350 [Streptomonospora nanhaiensis]
MGREIEELVREHRRSWDAGLPPEATVLERRYGFATKIAVEWSESAPAPVDRALRGPFVTALRITSRNDVPSDEWDTDPDSDETEPAPNFESGTLATLDLSRLDELDLSYQRIGTLGAQALAASAYFHSEATDVTAPATSTTAGRLKTLDLRYCRVGDVGLAALAASPQFGGVRCLHLQRNALSAAGVRSLHRFAGLTELDLRYNGIGEEGVRALLEAPFAGSLGRMLLNPDDVGSDGAKLLASAPHIPAALRMYWRSV